MQSWEAAAPAPSPPEISCSKPRVPRGGRVCFRARSVRRSAAGKLPPWCAWQTHPVECLPDQFDLLIGIDWLNARRFGAEIEVGPRSLVISDPRGGDLPPRVAASSARIVEMRIKELAKTIPDGRPNMVALGIVARLLGIDLETLSALIEKRLGRKGERGRCGQSRRDQRRM